MALAVALVGVASLSSCSRFESGETITIDEAAFAKKVRSTTSFNQEQADCVAREVFDAFTEEEIVTLYTEGVEPLRYTKPGELYVTIGVGCSVS